MHDRDASIRVKEADELSAPIIVESRLSDSALARRISSWIEESSIFEAGVADGASTVLIADHVPDDASAPVVLIASADSSQNDPRIMARFEPHAVSLKRLRIAVEAAANGMSVQNYLTGKNLEAGPYLTQREKKVLRLLAGGASNKAIARSLGISVHTVKFHVAAILEKLGARSRTEAVMQGLRQGLLMV